VYNDEVNGWTTSTFEIVEPKVGKPGEESVYPESREWNIYTRVANDLLVIQGNVH